MDSGRWEASKSSGNVLNQKGILEEDQYGHLSIRKMKNNLLHPKLKSCILCKLLIIKFNINIKVIYATNVCTIFKPSKRKIICIQRLANNIAK